VASLGLILLWNLEEGTGEIDKYQYSRDEYIKSGALMAFGIANAGISNENDPVFALLTEHLDTANDKLRVGIIAGLSIAYAGARREDVLERLSPLVIDSSISLENSALAALGLGLVFVGTCNDDVANTIIQAMMEKSDSELKSPYARFFALGLGLIFLGQQDRVSTSLSVMKELVKPEIRNYACLTAESCAYAGSGNVLKVQEMLHTCAEHLEEKDWQYQMVAVIGVSLIAMGENIGVEMALRNFDHLLQYGTINIRRALPLAMALLSISNPQVNVIDILSKLSHDPDNIVAQCAIFAIGMVGAGTNNSRLAGILRQLAGFYSGDENQLFMVRIAQGLLHLGKGLMSLDPYHSGRFLLSPVALGGILTVLHMMLDIDKLLHEHGHYFFFYLACAIYPRMLVTVDENLNPLPVQVRVGQAVDTVGQAGNPRGITGFQTHTTPVLLSYGEKAELATEEYEPLHEVLENFIILKKNPNYKPE
jgi:26S proteasome regulatory subunit N1